MKDTSKVIIGATLVMVVTLGFVIALILVLLAELYCSLLLQRHKHKNKNKNTSTTTTTIIPNNVSPSHSPNSPSPQNFNTNIYSQGVFQAPRNFLFPSIEKNISSKQQQNNINNKLHHHQVIHIQTLEEISSPKLSMSPFLSRAPPQQQKNTTTHQIKSDEISSCLDESSCVGSEKLNLVYISNPIYENEEKNESGVNTPFETPHSSPSHLEKSDSSCDDVEAEIQVEGEVEVCYTPPLTPMKKLTTEACSVSLRDSRSLSDSISRSVNGLTSSSSDSPSTSPSW